MPRTLPQILGRFDDHGIDHVVAMLEAAQEHAEDRGVRAGSDYYRQAGAILREVAEECRAFLAHRHVDPIGAAPDPEPPLPPLDS